MDLGDQLNKYVDHYRDSRGLLPFALDLKYSHSLRVAKNAQLIAREIGLAPKDIQLAHLCGLLHDVGRFSQYKQYGSFHDADTIDHGLAGRQVLEASDASLHFPPDEWAAILCTVEYHNKKTADLPGNFSSQSECLLRIIRDADKLDIMDLVLQSVARDGFRELPEMLPHIQQSREVTPAVLEEFQKSKMISICSLTTTTDFLLMLATWFYDFNYSASRQMAQQRDFLGRLAIETPDIPVVRQLFACIKKDLEQGDNENV